MAGARELRRRNRNDNLIGRRRKRDDDPQTGGMTLAVITRARGLKVTPIHLLFECASGYALFLAPGISQVGWSKFEHVEEYINRSKQPFKLEAFEPFSSDEDALVQMNAISKSIVSDKLKMFLNKTLSQPSKFSYTVATSNSCLGLMISKETGLPTRSALLIEDVMRALREKIDKFILLKPGELEKAQLNLARLYNNQTCTETDTKSPVVVSSSSSSSLQEQVGVVPHRFESVFIAKGKENNLCTRNLVPGEALFGEKLIRVQNEDKTEVEYRVWDPLRSKLAAAILGGVTDIWIKPGSRVLYVGNVCGLTVSDLSDLVGSDGLVYVVGFSDDVVDMAGKRLNVVTITEKCYKHWRYRMLVGMVDVIFAEIDYPGQDYPGQELYFEEANFTVNNAHYYLRAGGHYMISTQAIGIDSIFTYRNTRKEFKPIEKVKLGLMEGAYALAVGGYRMKEG